MFTSKKALAENNQDTVSSPGKQNDYMQEKSRQQLSLAQTRHDSPDALLKLFKDKLRSRGARGMVGLQRIFQIMDDDNSGSLT